MSTYSKTFDSTLLHQLLAHSSDLICLFNEKGEFLKVSHSVQIILGYSESDLLGRHYSDILPTEDFKSIKSNGKSEKEDQSPIQFKNKHLHKDGHLVYLQWSSNYDAQNNQVVGIAKVVTPDKSITPSEENEINKALINGTNNLVWTVDTNYKITGFNKRFSDSIYRDFKTRPSIGMDSFDKSIFDQGVISHWKALYGEVFKGNTVNFIYDTDDLKPKLPDRKWFSINLKPIYSSDKIIGIIVNSTDITDLKAKENELSERNALIEKVIQEIPMGVAVNEIENAKTVFVNEKFSEIYNWPAIGLEDVDNFLNKIYPTQNKDSQKMLKKIVADMESKDPKRMIWQNVAVTGQDGSTRYVNAKNIPLFKQNLMISTVQDNTSAHLNKIALEEAFKEKIEILNGISDSFYTLDKDYNFTFLNKHSLQIMQVAEEDIIGKHLFDVFPELKDTLFYKHLESVRKTGKAAKFELYHELYHTWFDERIYKTQVGFSVFFVDISIKKNFELRLEAAYQKQAEILESITDAFVALDEGFCFTYVNSEAENVFKQSKDELLGKKLFDIFPVAYGSEVYEHFNQSLKEQLPYTFEYHYKPSGIWFIVNVYPSGTGLSVYFRNITRAKQDEIELYNLNQSLKQKNNELEQFAFVTSHDLQEPLRIISSFMHLLEKHLGEKVDDTTKKYIQYAIEGSHRMRQIILDLLEYSRAGSHEENIEEVDCDALLHQVITLLDESVKTKKAKITHDNLPSIRYNATGLRQVLMNLIGNALKYVKKDQVPEVHISAQEMGAYYEFKVSDNGIGIQEKYYEQIFTIFKRLHNKSDYSGTGIGLAICKKVVEKYGGKISVSSQEGKGTTFTFTVPKAI